MARVATAAVQNVQNIPEGIPLTEASDNCQIKCLRVNQNRTKSPNHQEKPDLQSQNIKDKLGSILCRYTNYKAQLCEIDEGCLC